MAGAIVVTTSKQPALVFKYSVVWVSDASGVVTGSTFPMKAGTIIAVEFIPGSGALAPTDLYDCDLLDEHGASIFDNGGGSSIGSNLSATTATHALPLIGLNVTSVYRRYHQGGLVQPTIANAGDSNAGTIDIYITDGVL